MNLEQGPTDVLDVMRAAGVVPVVTIDDVDDAVAMGEAVLGSGLPCVEITLRTPAAVRVIEVLADRFDDLLVGAGTVLDPDQAEMARDAGARFAMAPSLDDAVVEWCIANTLPIVPGVATPTEVHHALAYGLGVVKFFPAEVAGGVAMIRALHSVYPGVGFIPTGGITRHNLAEYLGEASTVACGGTWLAPRNDIDAGRFDLIRERMEEAVRIVGEVRGGPPGDRAARRRP